MNYTLTAISLISLAMFFNLIIKHNQDAKNKIKQQRKKEGENREILSESPTWFTQDIG